MEDGERRSIASAYRSTKSGSRDSAQRRRDDRRMRKMTAQAILEKDDDYQVRRKRWVRLIVISEVIIVLALMGVSTVSPESPSYELFSYASSVLLVMAYAVIVIAVFYDFKKMKPIRDRAHQRSNSMSKKKAKRILEQAAQEEIDKQVADAEEVSSKKHAYRGRLGKD